VAVVVPERGNCVREIVRHEPETCCVQLLDSDRSLVGVRVRLVDFVPVTACVPWETVVVADVVRLSRVTVLCSVPDGEADDVPKLRLSVCVRCSDSV
jgi:hypothetical protein